MYKITAVRLKTGNNTYSEEMPIEVSVENVVWDQNTTLTDYLDTVVQNFAEEYTPSKYAVGDYCIYEGQLYKCNTAINKSESFKPAKWDQTDFATEISNVDISAKLQDLEDVEIASPSDNHILVYNPTYQEWQNVEMPLVNNVSINEVTLAEGQILKYIGDRWENVNLDLANLDGVSIEELEDNQVLMYDESRQVWMNKEIPLSNVSINDLTDGQILKYDASNDVWVNADKMDKVDPTGSGSFSLNRKADTTIGLYSTAEGYNNENAARSAHAEGESNVINSTAYYAHVEGSGNTANSYYNHIEGYQNTAASGAYGAHVEGLNNDALGYCQHVEGTNNEAGASASYAHVEGNGCTGSGTISHAEGQTTTASGRASHAEGGSTTASADYTHAQGYSTTASATYAHAQGSTNVASGSAAHAQGANTTASGDYSHAEGSHTTASDYGAHAEGYYTLASSEYQHVFGKYNIEDTYDTYIEIVGNGAKSGGTVTRANARTLDWQGNETLAGNLTVTGSVTYGNGINLGTQISGLNTRITKAVTNTAPNYSNASTYAVNDVVTYNDQLYICTTAVTIPEDFDSNKWQATTVFQYVGNGKSLIAGAITDKGVQTSATDSFATMANNISLIPSGGITWSEVCNWDFKTSLTDSIAGVTCTLSGSASRTDNDGVTFTSNNSQCTIPNTNGLFARTGMAIEVDIGSFTYNEYNRKSIIHFGNNNNGIINPNSNAEALGLEKAWYMQVGNEFYYVGTDNELQNSTIRIQMYDDTPYAYHKYKVYLNGVSKVSSTVATSITPAQGNKIILGPYATGTSPSYNAITGNITGLRIYTQI